MRFEGLGRTDKSQVTSRQNPQLMYGLHFHLCGQERRSHLVSDSVLVDTPGWGFVNHGSDVRFEGNVVYDFGGAGFVAEAGDERGAFVGNLAVGGRGVGTYDFRRIYLGQEDRIQAADLAFHGDGFWFASPFVQVRDNASIGNHGNGFVWYQVGVDARFVERTVDRSPLSLSISRATLSERELDRIAYRRPKRSWVSRPDDFILTDLPIFEPVEGNYAAANFVGLRLRYARTFNHSFHKKFWGIGDTTAYLQGLNEPSDRATVYVNESLFRDGHLQNNEVGIHTTYATRIRFSNFQVEADEQLQSSPAEDADRFTLNETTGIEMNHHSNAGNLLETVTVRGYEVGERLSPNPGPLRERIEVEYLDCIQDTVEWRVEEIRKHRR